MIYKLSKFLLNNNIEEISNSEIPIGIEYSKLTEYIDSNFLGGKQIEQLSLVVGQINISNNWSNVTLYTQDGVEIYVVNSYMAGTGYVPFSFIAPKSSTIVVSVSNVSSCWMRIIPFKTLKLK